MKPMDTEIQENEIVVLITTFGRYNTILPKTMPIWEIIVSLRTCGALGRLLLKQGQSSTPLTYITSSAILGVEFPKEKI